MLYIIIGLLLFVGAILATLLTVFKKVDKTLGTMCATATSLGGALLMFFGIGLRMEALRTYDELIAEKAYIEQNYDTDDLFTQLEVHDAYFKYMFKYNQVMEHGNESIVSQYYSLDLAALKLNIN